MATRLSFQRRSAFRGVTDSMLPAIASALKECFLSRRAQVLQREADLDKSLQVLPSEDASILTKRYRELYVNPFLQKLDAFERALPCLLLPATNEEETLPLTDLEQHTVPSCVLMSPEQREELERSSAVARSQCDALLREIQELQHERQLVAGQVEVQRVHNRITQDIKRLEEQIMESTTAYNNVLALCNASDPSLDDSLSSVYKELHARKVMLPALATGSIDTLLHELDTLHRKKPEATNAMNPIATPVSPKQNFRSTPIRFEALSNTSQSETGPPPAHAVRKTINEQKKEDYHGRRLREKEYRGRSIILVRQQHAISEA